MQAVASLYSIEILKDNLEACRQRLSDFVERIYTAEFKKEISNIENNNSSIHKDFLEATH